MNASDLPSARGARSGRHLRVPIAEHTMSTPGPGRPGGRDVHVYLDNDVKAHAPRDAERLAAILAGAQGTAGADDATVGP